MKKIILFTAAIAALSLFASCSKEQTPKKTTKVTVDIKVDDPYVNSKALKTGWGVGDKINIWFNNVPAGHYSYWKEAPHLVLTKTTGGWSSSEVDESLLSASGTFNAIYESTNSWFTSPWDVLYAYAPEGTSFKLAEWASSCGPRTVPTVCYNENSTYSYNSGTKKITGTISWSFMSGRQVVVTGLASTPDRYALTFGGGISTGEALYWNGSSFTVIYEGCTGITSSNNWSNGVSNPDGIAFNFYYEDDGGSRDYTIFLADKTDKKVYSFSKTTPMPSFVSYYGIKVDISKFTDITATHPFVGNVYYGYSTLAEMTPEAIVNLPGHRETLDPAGNYSTYAEVDSWLWICIDNEKTITSVTSNIFPIPMDDPIMVGNYKCYRSQVRHVGNQTCNFTIHTTP